MKCSVLQENLQQVIHDVQKSIPSKPTLPILGCLLIKAQGKTLMFSATDLQVGVRSTITATITQEGSAAVPAKVFIDYISTLNPGNIDLSLEGQTLTVTASDSHAKIQCFSPTDYPPFPEKEGDVIEMPMDVFTPAIQQTTFAASLDEARPVLTSLLFLFGEKMEVVSTDGFRLAKAVLDFPSPSPLQLLLPAKAMNEVLRIAARKKVETVVFTVSQKLKQAFFTFGDVEVLVRVMDGDFPPYQKIIPPDFQTEIVFDGSEFGQKMKTAMIFARESSGIIRLKIEEQVMKIISASSTLGTQESALPIKVIKGGNQEIAFNAKYVTDFLSVLKPETVWLGMNESLKPAMLRPQDVEKYSYIIMPFRVSQ